jgi:acyl-CoA reductase-like NAD-dependent aldehyde dehydrogenase
VFATFGQALVQAHAEKTAMDVMRKVDPAFTATMAGMADGIGKDDGSGLRGTVHSNWDAVLAAIRSAYAETPGTNRDARKRVLQQFLDAMDARDEQLNALEQLRTSLIALGEAHAAAARGNHGEAVFWIDRINGWLDDVKRRADELDKAQGKKS